MNTGPAKATQTLLQNEQRQNKITVHSKCVIIFYSKFVHKTRLSRNFGFCRFFCCVCFSSYSRASCSKIQFRAIGGQTRLFHSYFGSDEFYSIKICSLICTLCYTDFSNKCNLIWKNFHST